LNIVIFWCLYSIITGPQCFNKPSHIFITHTHGDHIASLPFTLIGDEDGNHVFQLYAPTECEFHLRKYIAALFEVNALMDSADMGTAEWYKLHCFSTPSTFRVTLNKSPFDVNVILCDHGIPTLSYCFSLVKHKLKDEYVGMPGKEIGALRKAGVEVTQEVVVPSFAFICDTSIAVLENFPNIVGKFPIVIIECTFLYPEELSNAVATKHIHWEQLKPYVLSNPSTLFVLIHFSLRYKEDEILKFFAEEQSLAGSGSGSEEGDTGESSSPLNSRLTNIKVWAGDTSENSTPAAVSTANTYVNVSGESSSSISEHVDALVSDDMRRRCAACVGCGCSFRGRNRTNAAVTTTTLAPTLSLPPAQPPTELIVCTGDVIVDVDTS
jgi:ribonuclease Z